MSRGGKRSGSGRPPGRCRKRQQLPLTVELEYRRDRALLMLYQRKLLQRGWAGSLTASDREYRLRARQSLASSILLGRK